MDPRACTIETIKDTTSEYDKLTHTSSEATLTVKPRGTAGYRLLWTTGKFDEIPDYDRPTVFSPLSGKGAALDGTWTDITNLAEDWARSVLLWDDAVKQYIGVPDLWSEISKIKLPANLASRAVTNGLFSGNERAEISRRIEEAKQQARGTLGLTAEQMSGIEQKLDDLVDASKRVGRRDWLVMLYGAAFGMIVNDTVPPHVVQGIITTVIHGLGHIFGLGGMPPALPPTA